MLRNNVYAKLIQYIHCTCFLILVVRNEKCFPSPKFPMRPIQKPTFWANFVSLSFANESIYGKYVRTICAFTYDEHFGRKIFAIGPKHVAGDMFGAKISSNP